MKLKLTSGLGCLLLLSSLIPSSAPAEVLDSSATGFTLEFSMTVDGDSERVFAGLTESISHWWLADHTWYGDSANMSIQAHLGGCLCERKDDKTFTEHLRVIKVESPRFIRFSGGLGPLQGEGVHGVMDWTLAPSIEVDKTKLTIRYRVGGYSPNDLSKWAPAVESVLQQQMTSLQTYLAK